jgi:pimeloyl-ACP methyl ester carboxylesterase
MNSAVKPEKIDNRRSVSSFHLYLKIIFFFNVLTVAAFLSEAQVLPGFKATGLFNEQELTIKDQWKNVQININAPLKLQAKGKTYLIIYALPNGNSIEWTKGKKTKSGDDWHFDIQHIAAQTRYVRNLDKKNTYIVAFLMAEPKSWPAWKRSTPNSNFLIKDMVDSLTNLFKAYSPKLVLNGHSGGGSLIFGFLDAAKEIPENIERIAFLDSNYGYADSLHTNKLTKWLTQSKTHKLVVLAYNDSLVIFNGKPLVSATGGTWYRSRLMQRNLSAAFRFSTVSDTSFIIHTALDGRVKFILKENPGGLILHTEQVVRNGFILSLLSSTVFDRKKHFTYFSNRAYEKYID